MTHQARAPVGQAWRQGLAFWLLLLSILTHAVVPAGSPLQRISGSAFSATTAEVAIAPKRKSAASEQVNSGLSDEGRSEGAGAEDPPLLPSAAPASTSWTARFETGPWPVVPFRPSEGGAAAFSARAPPPL